MADLKKDVAHTDEGCLMSSRASADPDRPREEWGR